MEVHVHGVLIAGHYYYLSARLSVDEKLRCVAIERSKIAVFKYIVYLCTWLVQWVTFVVLLMPTLTTDNY